MNFSLKTKRGCALFPKHIPIGFDCCIIIIVRKQNTTFYQQDTAFWIQVPQATFSQARPRTLDTAKLCTDCKPQWQAP